MSRSNGRAFVVGGGIGGLAAAAFMIRDGGMRGDHITIFEASPSLGGCIEAGGDPREGYAIHGTRMMTAENFECTWKLFESIPSLTTPGKSVTDETIDHSKKVKWDARARLIDRNRAIVDVSSMGFRMKDRVELLKLSEASEEDLADTRITDWLSPGFFETNFWYMWQTTFAFQPWHSALEFKRYMHRFIVSFSRIEKLSGVKHPVYNHYDSLIRPLVNWLEGEGVHIQTHTSVTDFDLATEQDKLAVTGVHLHREGNDRIIRVDLNDLVVLQNGSMTDASSFGSMTNPPKRLKEVDSGAWRLWEKLAEGRQEFGNPAKFNSSISETHWLSFTVTMWDTVFFDMMEHLTGNKTGTGGIITFKDSRWLMSIVLHHQPHFADQPEGVQVFWGYALHPDRVGDFVAKPMSECSGQEILRELCGHLNFVESVLDKAACIPCHMPYITSQFMPRRASDRPLPVPRSSRNLAMVSQFVEIPDDVVFTIEYSIRAAQMAVYQLLDVKREIPPVTPYDKSLKVQLKALVKAFK
jgi:oleate hydratase